MAAEDEPGAPGRDAVPRRPTPARPPAPDAERERLQAEVAELHDQLAVLDDALATQQLAVARERDGWATERRALQARIDEVSGARGSSPELADLVQRLDALVDRMRSLAEPPGSS